MEILLSLADATNRFKETGSKEHNGTRIDRYDNRDVKQTKEGIKSRLKNRKKKNTDMNGGSYGPIGKMHMRKANWLGLMERGKAR